MPEGDRVRREERGVPPTIDAPVTTHLPTAHAVVIRRCRRLGDRIDGLEAFAERIAAPDAAPTRLAGLTAALAERLPLVPSPDSPCGDVGRAFRETIQPTLDEEKRSPLREAMAAELSPMVAAAVTTDGRAATGVRRAAVLAAGNRVRALRAERAAVEREAADLVDAHAVVEAIRCWFHGADAEPLTDRSFPVLRRYHVALGEHRSRCQGLIQARQTLLSRRTTVDGRTVTHRELAHRLYEDRDGPDFPVLATAAVLARTCETARRRVRRHLTATA